MQVKTSHDAGQLDLSPVNGEFKTEERDRVSTNARYVPFCGFTVRREDLTRNRRELSKIESLGEVDRQFIATLIDTEAAIGYFLRRSGRQNNWTAYVSVKMIHSGVVNHFAELVGFERRRRPWQGFNSLTGSTQKRWSIQISGLLAFFTIKSVEALLYNEKSKAEANCILQYGPVVKPPGMHPFLRCGATPMKRGVWIWPDLQPG